MDFWNREVENSFDEMFDLNHDGKLNFAEQAFQQDFIVNQMDEDDRKADFDEDDVDDLDLDDLEMMDEDERREALEEMGLDPDDYDDF